jgi:hypothetical protein
MASRADRSQACLDSGFEKTDAIGTHRPHSTYKRAKPEMVSLNWVRSAKKSDLVLQYRKPLRELGHGATAPDARAGFVAVDRQQARQILGTGNGEIRGAEIRMRSPLEMPS